ncbi:MAG: EAL domain-containing protein [Candidatus Dormibacteria bacterium]
MPISKPTRRVAAARQPTDSELDGILGELFQQTTLPLAIVGFDHLVKRANGAFCQLLERSPDELIGTHILELTHPEDRRASQIASWGARRGRSVKSVAKRYLRPDGAPVWVRVTPSLLRDDKGDPLCILTQAEDISQEERLRLEVQQLGQLHAALAESSEAMLRAESVPELWEQTCRIAVERGGLHMAWIGRIRGDGSLLPDAHWGSRGDYLQTLRTSTRADIVEGQGPVGFAIRSGLPIIIQNVELDPRFDRWRERALAVGIGGVATFPLRQGGVPVGAMAVYSPRPEFFNPQTTELLERLANSVAFAWEAFELRDREATAAGEVADRLARFHHVFQLSGIAIAITDLDLIVQQANGAMRELLRADEPALHGRALLDFVAPADRGSLMARCQQLPVSLEVDISRFALDMLTSGGDPLQVLMSANAMPETEGRGRYLVWQAQNITAQRQAEDLAQRKMAQQAAVAALGREAIEARDLSALHDHCAHLLAEHLGADKATVLRWNPALNAYSVIAVTGWNKSLVTEALVPGGARSMAGVAAVSGSPVIMADTRSEVRFDASTLASKFSVRSGIAIPISTGDRHYGVLAVFTTDLHAFNQGDIDFAEGIAHVLGAAVARSEAEAEMQRQALHDSLTGLPNRALLVDRMELSLSRLRREHHSMAVMFVDIDRFKTVNDSMGHAVGDAVLRTVAARLASVLRPADTVARVGGDEFVILAEDLESPDSAMAMAQRLVAAVELPMPVDDREVVVTASIGVINNQDPDLSAERLVRDADIAMYQAKSEGGRRALQFASAMRDVVGERVQVELDLRSALKQRELVVHYQPSVDLRSGEIVGAEALVRWNHPTRGLVPPLEFIPLAEATGAIMEIGAWVLREACRAAARWSAMRQGAGFSISVNVSPRQLVAQDLVHEVAAALKENHLLAEQLCIEITETAVLTDSPAAVSALAALHNLGVHVSLDDFGTGYSSVSHLRRFQLDELKIDQSFITGITENKRDEAIVSGLIQLAHSVGLWVAAEGVETAAQRTTLQRLGCDLAQGYLMSRPVSAERFEALWLSAARL